MATKNKLSDTSEKDLIAAVNAGREVVRNFRFGTAGAATRDVRAVRAAKKEVARALTELNRRQRDTQSAA